MLGRVLSLFEEYKSQFLNIYKDRCKDYFTQAKKKPVVQQMSKTTESPENQKKNAYGRGFTPRLYQNAQLHIGGSQHLLLNSGKSKEPCLAYRQAAGYGL